MDSMKTQALMLSEIGKLMNEEVSKRLQAAQVGVQASRADVENAATRQKMEIIEDIRNDNKRYKESQTDLNQAKIKSLESKGGELNMAKLLESWNTGGNSMGFSANSVQ
jgi:hypothetical protein